MAEAEQRRNRHDNRPEDVYLTSAALLLLKNPLPVVSSNR